MLILAIDTSAKSVSAAICRDEDIIADFYLKSGQTHSLTLLPAIDSVLSASGVSFEELDCFACSSGPGSFTGLRIGISAVKGFAWALEKPCYGASTLAAMAWNHEGFEGTICCVMDARREQLYNALFRFEEGKPVRLCKDRAISMEELSEELKNIKGSKILVGDGADLCYNAFGRNGGEVFLSPPHLRYQNAYGVAREAAREGKFVQPGELSANYIRLSQAERQLLSKK